MSYGFKDLKGAALHPELDYSKKDSQETRRAKAKEEARAITDLDRNK
jgi:hypothetical protein